MRSPSTVPVTLPVCGGRVNSDGLPDLGRRPLKEKPGPPLQRVYSRSAN